MQSAIVKIVKEERVAPLVFLLTLWIQPLLGYLARQNPMNLKVRVVPPDRLATFAKPAGLLCIGRSQPYQI